MIILGKEEDGVGLHDNVDGVVEAVIVGLLSSRLLLQH